MMVQDQLSGAVHEVPDHLMGHGVGVGEPVYDGFGNPVGFNPFKAIGNLVSTPFNLIRGLLPGGAPRPPGFPMPGGYPGYPRPAPYGARPWPAGWRRAPLPYTGLGPQRLYMRCAVWPGPKNLTPGHVLNMPAAGMPGAGGGGRRRRRRRR